MNKLQRSMPGWIIIVSALFALMEIAVSLALWFSPESVVETIDLKTKGVDYLIQMWAVRQFALGFIFAYATLKKSTQMLTIAYIFLLVMFFGDLIIGILQQQNSLIISAIVMCIISSAMIYTLNRKKIITA